MTAGAGLLRGSLWTLLAQAGPALAGLILVPRILLRIGSERFGLLALVWMIIGYFSLLDLGLTRAVTQLVAGGQDGPTLSKQLRVATTIMLLLGSVGGLLLAGSAWFIATVALSVPRPLVPELLTSLLIMAAALPVTLLTSAYRSIAEGKCAFLALSVIRGPLGIANFVGPWVVTLWSSRLDLIVGVLMVLRLAGLVLHAGVSRRLVGRVGFGFRGARGEVLRLLRFGGWITVSNVVSPLMTSIDRFVVGAMLSLGAVAYYAAPYEAITKLWMVAGAVGAVTFPHFSRTTEPGALKALQTRAITIISLILLPAVVLVLGWSRQLMAWWIDTEYAAHSANVAKLLAVGVLVNALAIVPLSLIQGQGRPDVTAKFHLLELPLYLALLVAAVRVLGIEGAALAFVLRVTADAALLLWFSRRFTGSLRGSRVLVGYGAAGR